MNAEDSSGIAPSAAAPTLSTNTTPSQRNTSLPLRTNSSNNNTLPSHRQRTIPRLRSNLSSVDSKFIELARCLYQAKAIVQDLSSFYASVLPALSLSTCHDPALSPQKDIGSVAFFQHIKQYLDDNFTKFTRLCKVLLMILSRLEQNAQVKQERVQSFRNEIMEEWRVASDIKRRIQAYLHQNNSLFDGSSGTMEATTSSQSDIQQQRQQDSSTPVMNSSHGYSNVPPHLFPSLHSLDQQRSSSTSTYADSSSIRHSYHQYSGMTSISDMASGNGFDPLTCSDSPTTQMGSPTSTVSG